MMKGYVFNTEEVTNNLVNWIKNYFNNIVNKECKAVIGISGGKDSAVAAAACVNAIGKERVLGIYLPKDHLRNTDDDYMCKLIYHLDIEHNSYCIKDIIDMMCLNISNITKSFNGHIDLESVNINTPARIRMAILYGIANAIHGRVVNTCNASEDYIGYSTKFGDTAGDFSPLCNLTATEVKQVGLCLGLPEELVNRPPEDGLCGKTDEDYFGFTYEVLDKYIRTGECEDEEVKKKINLMRIRGYHKIVAMPSFDMLDDMMLIQRMR